MEWVLILAMNLNSDRAMEVRDISQSMLGGFTSKERCEAAGVDISMKLISLSGDYRKSAGIKPNFNGSIPALRTECILIRK